MADAVWLSYIALKYATQLDQLDPVCILAMQNPVIVKQS